MKILIALLALLLPIQPWACESNVYHHKGKSVYYDGFTFYPNANKMAKPVMLTSVGTGIPYRTDLKGINRKYIFEPVRVYNPNSEELGGQMWAILINDILYRPDCN